MYLVSEDYGDFKELMSYKELKGFLVDELVRYVIENHTEYDIAKQGVHQLEDVAKDRVNEDYIVDLLKSYGWTVLNICDVQKNINDLREYVARKDSNLKAFDDVLKYIDEELK